ncbi:MULTISPECIES: hypothetical protein [Leucobacter]|uniref:Uncharacterized protein n=2 Tax=Leucobacter TaxID=55968 RepID=A0A4Q7U3W4_9MICO|nr:MULTISPECIES: hypothetical protein [Leucobacter]MBL3691134.1 hypothetical protein [Leucobacter chromiireducens subsp. chromiireducens]MBL3700789.1 hypothetical protein [Leucobacter luti]RZT68374.1 hypothetical protein EV139_0097 [Leucobacter luti]
MFTPPRFIVIDDDLNHLEAIATTIQALGSVCARVHYTPEKDAPKELFAAARAIFIDLQLQDRSASSDFNRHFAEIQRILGKFIQPTNGPYILVLWTDEAGRVAELQSYLETNLFASTPHTKPIAIVPLSKTDYIDIGTGEQTAGDLVEDIRKHLSAQPAMNALVQWEAEVLSAATRVLSDITTLTTELDGDAPLPTLLKRLAVEAVGHANAADDPRASVHAAFLPLLQDHLQNASEVNDEWSRAFESATEPAPALSKAQVSMLNTKLHITQPDKVREISPVAWGAVCEPEANFDWNEFGLDDETAYMEQILAKGVRIDLAKYKASVAQIRIGAACDYAQKAVGPIPYALAALLPVKEGEKSHELNPKSTGWVSPELDLGKGIVQIFVDPRFVRVRGAKTAASFNALGRIKEQLLLELVSVVSHHSSRPGIVRFKATAR